MSKSNTNNKKEKGVSAISSKFSLSSPSKESQKSQGSQSSFKSQGMGPSLRMTSTDIRELTKESQAINLSGGGLIAEGGAPPGESVYDTIAYIIYCPDHKKVAISRADKDNIQWLPFIAGPPNKTWKSAGMDGISIIFNKQDAELDAKLGTKIPIKSMSCLHVYRTQVSSKQRFISLVINLVKLKRESSQSPKEQSRGSDKNKKPPPFKCCQNTKRIKWYPIKEVVKGNVENVWGPEVQKFAAKCYEKDRTTGLTERSLERALSYLPKKQPKSPEEVLIKGAGIGETEIEKLYDDYIDHCFPSFSMSFDSFKAYMTKYLENYDRNDSRFSLLFNAFDYDKNSSLSFHELLLGLASMEPNAPNEESRIVFVFRYYDIDGDGKISESELKKLIKDVSIGTPEATLNAKVREAMQQMGAKDGGIDVQTFYKGIANKILKGTSGLCKASKSILSQITQTTTNREAKKSEVKKRAGFLLQNRRNKGICFACKGKKYDYGLHTIKMDTNGRCVEPRRIFEPETFGENMTPQRYSIEYTFNTRTIANSFIDLIRNFSLKKRQSKGFMSNDRETLFNYLQVMGNDLESFLASEDRCIKVNSPTYVFGDIYSNLDDLLMFEKHLFQSFPIVSSHYVFLGNYVDRGNWGIECAIYLLSLKLISPLNFILLRGTHESRDVQTKGSFQKECKDKYGDKMGLKIWELINSMFDKMPICAIIDESIFCTHSGVPKSATKVEDINKVSSNLKNPEKNSIASEIMNGDSKKEELRKFLKTFDLSHVIRSNGLTDAGYSVQYGGKELTIFSSSYFSGKSNEAVTAFVDADRIRIIGLDTISAKEKSDPKTETLSKSKSGSKTDSNIKKNK